MRDWKGGIIAEGLGDPAIINDFTVCEATITEHNMPIDYEEHAGR
jgi:hypothetical protein